MKLGAGGGSTEVKRLLVLSAKESEVPFILLAKSMGYYVITTGNDPDQVGHKYADEYAPFDYSDYQGITNLARDLKVGGVFQGTSDNCALTAAYICDHLGLSGHDDFQTAEIIHRKDKFKEFAALHKIKSPLAKIFLSREEALSGGNDRRFPLIIKPNDLAGGQGISVARDQREYEESVEKAFNRSGAKRIVVEPYLTGTVHSLHTFIINKKVTSFATADDYSYMNKYMTNSGIFPAENWQSAVEVLIPEVERIAELLRLVDGPLSMQYIMHNGDPWIIEMMRRSPGNHTTAVMTNSIGLNWREWVIRAESGESIYWMPRSHLPQRYYGYQSVMAPHNGIFKQITIEPEIRKYIFQTEQWVEPGHIITNYLEEKFGHIQLCFDTEEEKRHYMPRIDELIHIEYMD